MAYKTHNCTVLQDKRLSEIILDVTQSTNMISLDKKYVDIPSVRVYFFHYAMRI